MLELAEQLDGEAGLFEGRVFAFVVEVLDKVFEVVGGDVQVLQVYVGHVEVVGETL